MKNIVSALALAAALIAVPAVAQKKGKPEAGQPAAYSFQLSKAYRAAAAPAQAALKAQDVAGSTEKLAALEAVSVSPDEKFITGQLKLQLSGLNKDMALQDKAITEMIASGSGAATAELGKLNFYVGQAAYNKRDYPRALQYLTAADQAGFRENEIHILLAETYFQSNNTTAGLTALQKAIAEKKAANQPVPEGWYRRGVAAAYKAKARQATNGLMRELVLAYPTPTNWRDALVLYRDAAKLDSQQAVDVYRLMRQAKALDGERDYYEYAEFAERSGLPGEAKAVVDEGFATGKAPRTSKPLNDILTTANGKVAADRNSLAAGERAANAAATGRQASATADAFLGYGDNAKAIALYRVALQKGGVDADQVNTRLGIALARAGQKEEAKAAFAAVKGPRAEIAAFWTLYLNQTV